MVLLHYPLYIANFVKINVMADDAAVINNKYNVFIIVFFKFPLVYLVCLVCFSSVF